MATPESPSTPTSKPPQSLCTPLSRLPYASPVSSHSSSSSRISDRDEKVGSPDEVVLSHGDNRKCRDDVVREAAQALVKAADLYKQQNEQAVRKKESFDGLVQVDISSGESLTIEELGEACVIAKRSVGKLKVLASSGQVFIRQVASGYVHGQAAVEVLGEIRNATVPFSDPPSEFVGVGTDGMYGNDFISAPDVTVQSLGLENGQPTGDSEVGPLFFAEVEHGNRSLPELIRHLGVLLANYPNLNGVLGIKGEHDRNGNRVNALIMIEWRDITAGEREPHVTHLVDFGPHPYSDTRKRNVNNAVTLPLPPMGEVAQSGVHGAGAVDHLPEWMRFPNGMDGGNPATIHISPTLLLAGAHSVGDNGTVIDIPGTALGANINLARLARIYGRG